jgi:general secretion pathway protein F
MRFEVRALDRTSQVINQVFDAVDAEAAATQAGRQGLAVLGVRTHQEGGWRSIFGRSGRAFPLGLFSQELVTLLQAGLSVVEAVETLREKEAKPERRQLLTQLVAHLYQGHSLSQALEQFPAAFPALYVATVRASERTGDLPEALGRYVAYQAQLDLVKKKIVSASIYPVILLAVGALVIAFLLGYVVPRFARLFDDIGRDLPYLSRLLIDWGGFVANHGWALAGGLAIVVPLAVVWLTNPATRQMLLTRLLSLPTLGERARIYQLARFYRTLGMLLRGGIPIMSALTMTGGLLQGGLRQRLTAASGRIREGMPISQAMEGCGLTTPVASRMLRVGERTGQMGEMMERIAHFYDEEIARWVDWFVRLFEPLLMAGIGIAIGGIVVLMYFPIFELAGSIQ